MSIHVFANLVTAFGTAANNRAETAGNVTTLQKLIWKGAPHSSVSAEAIRFALRRRLGEFEEQGTNRRWDEDQRVNHWQDWKFEAWAKKDAKTYIDDDLLGFMTAEASKEEGVAGKANVRRAVLEVTRAVSMTPWPGDVTFNAASPGATPSAQKKGGRNPVPYGTEVHATRFQYGFALTPQRLRETARARHALQALCDLGPVAGNHGRFLFDFSPEYLVIRITQDPAPRILYCFEAPDDGETIDCQALLRRVEQGDINARELILGGLTARTQAGKRLLELGAFGTDNTGVRAAAEEAGRRLSA